MKSITRLLRNGLPLLTLLLLSSCGENHALMEDTYYFQEENRSWLTEDLVDDDFVMIDNQEISHSFSMLSDTYYFNKGWSTFAGITTHISHTEYHYQQYRSNYGARYSFSLTAGSPPHGDDIYMNLNDVGFSYDLSYGMVTRLDTPFGYKSYLMTDTGYEADEEILSEAVVLDTCTINSVLYHDVMHFRFLDFVEQWSPFTITEIYVAKNSGLVKFVMHDGIIFEREAS